MNGIAKIRKIRYTDNTEAEYKYDALGRIVEIRSCGEVVECYWYTICGREIAFTDRVENEFKQRKIYA
jgi:YD repeat-containing protein